MAFKKKYIHVIMVLLIGYFVCACRQADEISGEQWAKGYNLPVEEQEAKEAENDCKKMMALIFDIYKDADKGTASNGVLKE